MDDTQQIIKRQIHCKLGKQSQIFTALIQVRLSITTTLETDIIMNGSLQLVGQCSVTNMCNCTIVQALHTADLSLVQIFGTMLAER